MGEGGELPVDLTKFNEVTESGGTRVHLPTNRDSGLVFKVEKGSHPAGAGGRDGLERAKEFRRSEEVSLKTASSFTKRAIAPQSYVVVEGESRGESRTARVQPYVRGVLLRELGFSKIMNLDQKDTETLKSILKDSIKCYLTYGTNYDLSGSDERDALKKSRLLNLKRLMFPLRNSVNLILTSDGIKLIDPNVLGVPGGKQSVKLRVLQGVQFISSIVDLVLLSTLGFMHQLGESFPKSITPKLN